MEIAWATKIGKQCFIFRLLHGYWCFRGLWGLCLSFARGGLERAVRAPEGVQRVVACGLGVGVAHRRHDVPSVGGEVFDGGPADVS